MSDQSGNAWIVAEYVKRRKQTEIGEELGYSSAEICSRIAQFCASLGCPVKFTLYGDARIEVASQALRRYKGEILRPTRSTDPRLIFAYARMEHAWLLRAEGFSLRQIGARLGISRARASQMIGQFGRKVKRATHKTRFRMT